MKQPDKELWNSEIKKFHQTLFDPRTNELRDEFIEKTSCPSCHEAKSSLLFVKDSFKYHRCSHCHLVYMNPRMNKAATLGFYNSPVNQVYNISKFDQTEENSFDSKVNQENLQLLNQHVTSDHSALKLLEVGCAKGFFLSQAQKSNYEVWGVELNLKNADIAKKRLGERIFTQDLFEINFPASHFDIIYSRDLIEHIHNPDEFLEEVSRILKPGGLIFFETHNIDSLINKIVKEKHTVIFGFEHPVHWSPETLSFALARHGVHTVKTIYQSRDFTLKAILRYYAGSTFTTIYSWKAPPPLAFFVKVAVKILNLPILKQLDNHLMPAIANSLKKGSTMKLVARKKQGTH